VIEVDARLPSQTPTAVYHCCGVNIVALLAEAALGRSVRPARCEPQRAVVYQHILVADGGVQVVGEHVLAEAGPLHRENGFYGATLALTDHTPGAERWVATLVVEAAGVDAARRSADDVVRAVALDMGLTLLPESRPLRAAVVP
jgi:pyrrolysine biosynthesis protein PylC